MGRCHASIVLVVATFRYLVNDVEKSVSFYTQFLDFNVEQQFGPAMAIVSRNDVTLWHAGPMSSAARPMPSGQVPQPGGWNRFVVVVDNLQSIVTKLKSQDVPFRNEIVSGPGGQQILCEDPSGNVIELFQPA